MSRARLLEREPTGSVAGDDASAPAPGEWRAHGHQASLSLGFLAMLPLLAAYELVLGEVDPRLRNASELLLFRVLAPLGEHTTDARRIVLLLATLASLWVCFRRRVPLIPGAFRIFLEGALGALLLGPALALLVHVLGAPLGGAGVGPLPAGLQAPPALARAAQILGGAAYEEIVFRVLAYALLFLLVQRSTAFLGLAREGSRLAGELAGVLGSAVLFAAFHLALFTSWLAPGGEAFSGPVFTWRLLAGILLALIFRWRGPGVAAWTHGLFNLALFLGAGPEAFL
jgi:membrane protease YdiL (CAAX protease family)